MAPAKRTIFVTGSAGFIGFHLSRLLLEEGFAVTGYDAMTDYYDPRLKRRRHALLAEHPAFSAHVARLEDHKTLRAAVAAARPDALIHLAAQAGVRYSLENPRAYVDSNLTGTFNVMECARELGVGHFMVASTSSVYGDGTEMPFHELQKTDRPLTLYAATKKAAEAMTHSYAHLWGIPTTLFRFFTVYGPWGRPDMALWKFVDAAEAGRPIDLYNAGDMSRDFTHVSDLVRGIRLLMDAPPPPPEARGAPVEGDSLSPSAPWRVVNIGASQPVRLLDMVAEIERALGRPIRRNLLPMQAGDVPATWADTGLLERLTGFRPRISVREGVEDFVAWRRAYAREQAEAA